MTARPTLAGFRLAVLITWKEEGRWYFLRRLRQEGLDVMMLRPVLLDAPRPIVKLSVWLSPIYLSLVALLRARRLEAIASWSIPFAAVVGQLLRFTRRLRRARPLHIVRDFHIDRTREHHRLYAAKLAMLRGALDDVDLAFTTSHAEAAGYATLFRRPPSQFAFLPDAPPSELFEVPAVPTEDFVFAYGNSDRDFDTLMEAAGQLDVPVVVLSQTYRPARPLPVNVRLLRHYVSRQELVRLIGSALCCVVPLKAFEVAAGQNSMFETMALGRPLVVSNNVAIEEYVTPQQNALLFPPGDAQALADQVRFLLQHPQDAANMGRQARETAKQWLELQVTLFLDALAELAAAKHP